MNWNTRDVEGVSFRKAVFRTLLSSRPGFLDFTISGFLEDIAQLLEQREGDHDAAILGKAGSQKDPGNPLVLTGLCCR